MQSYLQSTNDLRSRAVDRKREKQQKAKWSPAWAVNDIPTVKIGPNDTKRPARQYSKRAPAAMRRTNERDVNRKHDLSKQDHLNGKKEHLESGSSGSSCSEPEEDAAHYEDVPCDEPEQRGELVLALALDKAVIKFEDNQTTMLVKNEYEVLDDDDIEKDDVIDLANEDDDYELV